MTDSITISIVIPVYKVSMYIERCVRSVMNQTYNNFECILVDDATPDDSIAKCEKLIENYHGPINFIILHHEQNKGVSASRNTGTKAASGDYIFYLDSDDEITPDCIEKMIQPILNDPTIEMVQGNHTTYYLSDTQGQKYKNQTNLQESDFDSNKIIRDFFYIKKGYIGYVWNKLIKKDFINHHQLYFKEGVKWEDLLWSFYSVKYLNHLYIIPDITLLYFVHPQSIMTGTNKKEKAHDLEITYNEIANHFSADEKGMEATKYLRPFCSNFIDNYNSKLSQRTAQLFLEAFADNQYKSERLYLQLTILFSKFSLGRWLFAQARSLRKSLNKDRE